MTGLLPGLRVSGDWEHSPEAGPREHRDTEEYGGHHGVLKNIWEINKHFESSQKLRKDGIGIWENYVKLYAVYWYWYTVHARSLINYVLSLSIPNFQNEYIWNTV